MKRNPSRSRSKDGLPLLRAYEEDGGYSPSGDEVAELREAIGLSQAEFARLVYRSVRIVQYWESSGKSDSGRNLRKRQCPLDTWEYVNLLAEYPEVRRCREQWLRQVDSRRRSRQAKK